MYDLSDKYEKRIGTWNFWPEILSIPKRVIPQSSEEEEEELPLEKVKRLYDKYIAEAETLEQHKYENHYAKQYQGPVKNSAENKF